MKKLVSIVALLTAVLIATSAYTDSNTLAVGDEAPEVTVDNQFGHFNLKEEGDDYVLLTFWSTSDAQSRIDCNAYSAWASKHPEASVKHVGVNFDRDRALFEEVVRLDGLDSKAQYNVNGPEAQSLMIAYGLLEGFGTILISPEGRIMSFNPSKSKLASLM